MRLLTSNTYNILIAVLIIVCGLVGAHYAEQSSLRHWLRALSLVAAVFLVFIGAVWLGLVVTYNGFNPIVN
ncbi:hypothetical protein AYR62_04860 [Secundilactobacillus paracollinoides]|uniref:Uncharacterized protein n=1 Tax=Secundilactobacillus paracollinoides TaxID=240427 RepID=A0A1B2J093_9LACO|nr:hypothetical protein [Secundilactobacillus paracollinoides]ANZ63482.1 hypothetical protein AYR62_04860 [Secundilactobacillus paracollinoides]ANZ67764.1 hypothetical protein AYR63_11890 [Secundilactobacillus paracollinoides]KRL75757.1 hypothetical protein FC17_GL002487 [Secundilactobacillus paracollinoides DSM 15502 = JCM 11969]